MEDYSKSNSDLNDKKPSFDFNSAVKDLLAGKKLTGEGGILTPLIKELVETALTAELDSHIARDVIKGQRNRKNGFTSKTVKTSEDSFELDTPRDRSGSFEPQIIKKYQTSLSSEIEDRILSMYALGMSYTDISKHIEEIYQISVSPATISAITDKIIDKVKE